MEHDKHHLASVTLVHCSVLSTKCTQKNSTSYLYSLYSFAVHLSLNEWVFHIEWICFISSKETAHFEMHIMNFC